MAAGGPDREEPLVGERKQSGSESKGARVCLVGI
jgi:hypothetical protein